MRIRIRLSRFLLQLGDFIRSLPVVVMKPDDLVEFSRQWYARVQNVESLAQDALIESGLSEDELALLDEVPEKTGELLLLGVGGGREAVPLGRMGYRVTGVDYVAAMVERATKNAARYGVAFEGLVQEISQLDVSDATYDVVWLSRSMYSCVPTRARRVDMVRRIAKALRPGGFFLLQFHSDPQTKKTDVTHVLRRLIAILTLGNLTYEEGDMLWGSVEFLHAFSSEETLRAELEDSGLRVVSINMTPTGGRSSAVCRKRLETCES